MTYIQAKGTMCHGCGLQATTSLVKKRYEDGTVRVLPCCSHCIQLYTALWEWAMDASEDMGIDVSEKKDDGSQYHPITKTTLGDDYA